MIVVAEQYNPETTEDNSTLVVCVLPCEDHCQDFS